MRVAPAFHDVIRPSSVLVTIASSDDATMAARCAESCSARHRSVMSIRRLIAPVTRPEASCRGVGKGGQAPEKRMPIIARGAKPGRCATSPFCEMAGAFMPMATSTALPILQRKKNSHLDLVYETPERPAVLPQ